MSKMSRGFSIPVGRVFALAAALSLGACASSDIGLGLGSSEPAQVAEAPAGPTSELEKATGYWAKEVEKNPRDGKATINYVRNLKALGRKQEALAAIQAGYLFNGENRDYLSEYGRLALDAGQVNLAAQLLERADDPAKPDWRVISARGTAMAKQGEYKEAIPFFERARELAPNQASVMNNLAMAYTMDGQAQRAEELLRQAEAQGTSDPRVKQNLALVLGLQGKAADAKTVTAEKSASNEVPEPQPHFTVTKAPAKAGKGGKSDAFSRTAGSLPAGEAAATAPVTQVTSTSLEPDEIMKAAMKAEEAKKKAETGTKKRKQTVASADDAPGLKGAAP